MQLKRKTKQKSKESQTLLVELQERIYAIELLHRQLYQSTSLKEIDFDVYVRGLIDNMRHTYATDEKNIVLNITIQKAYLGIEQALACGLLINECVTNAIKHAFNEQGGAITITFTCNDKICTLTIHDNGKGFLLEDLDSSTTQGLGMQLIKGIANQQLQGKMAFHNRHGAYFYFDFLKD